MNWPRAYFRTVTVILMEGERSGIKKTGNWYYYLFSSICWLYWRGIHTPEKERERGEKERGREILKYCLPIVSRGLTNICWMNTVGLVETPIAPNGIYWKAPSHPHPLTRLSSIKQVYLGKEPLFMCVETFWVIFPGLVISRDILTGQNWCLWWLVLFTLIYACVVL